MNESKNITGLDKLKEALLEVPEEHRADVVKSLAHDLGVIARTIQMVVNG